MELLPANTTQQLGIYSVDNIYCCKAETMLDCLPEACIDLIVTSPPYDNLRLYRGFEWDFQHIARQSYRVLKPGGVLVWVVGDATINGSETLTSFEQALYFKKTAGFNVHDTMVFHKNASSPNTHHPRYLQEFEYMFVLSKGIPQTWNPVMRIRDEPHKAIAKIKTQKNGMKKAYGGNLEYRQPCPLGNVWLFDVGAATGDDLISFDHPAPFPEALAERHILTWSNPGDIVLDYFTGSGTTAKMARANNRRYLGCDISAEYVALAQKRLAQPYTPNMFETLGVTA